MHFHAVLAGSGTVQHCLMLHATSLTFLVILGVLNSSAVGLAHADEPQLPSPIGASPGSCLLQTARGSVALERRLLDTKASGEPIKCQVFLPLLTERSDRQLKRLCKKSFSKSDCQEAHDALLQRPWSAKAVGQACKHLGRGAEWHLRSATETIALLHRRGLQNNISTREQEARMRNRVDETLKFKDDEDQPYVQEPPYNESGEVKPVPSGVYDAKNHTRLPVHKPAAR